MNQCCFLVSCDNELVTTVLQLFYSLLSKQDVKVEGKTLAVAVTWVLDVLKRKNRDSINLGLLVLQELVKAKSHMVIEFNDKILKVCFEFMSEFSKEDPPGIFLECLNCVECLTRHNDENFDESIVPKSCDIFLKFLFQEINVNNPIWKCKCLITAMRGLSNIVEKDISLVGEILPEIFGSIKGYMFYGLEDDYKIDKVIASNIALPEEMKPKQNVKKGKYVKKSKKKNLTSISKASKDEEEPVKSNYTGFQEMVKLYITSDSDFSESEGGNTGKLRHLVSKVRRCSLILMRTLLIKGDLKNLTRFLPSFLPDGSQTRTLMTCLLQDPSATVRSEVLTVLSIILTKFKPFMLLADSTTKSSFTTISNNVAEIIKNLHIGLNTALKNENYKIVNTQLLKTIADLVRCSPYHKLEKNLLTELSKEVGKNLKKRDVNIEIASLVVFGCIASVNPQIDEIVEILFHDHWLFQHCAKILKEDGNFNTAVAVEFLQVLAALIRNFPFRTVIAFPKDVIKLLEFTSSKHDFIIRLYAAKLMEAVVNAVQMSVAHDGMYKKKIICG